MGVERGVVVDAKEGNMVMEGNEVVKQEAKEGNMVVGQKALLAVMAMDVMIMLLVYDRFLHEVLCVDVCFGTILVLCVV